MHSVGLTRTNHSTRQLHDAILLQNAYYTYVQGMDLPPHKFTRRSKSVEPPPSFRNGRQVSNLEASKKRADPTQEILKEPRDDNPKKRPLSSPVTTKAKRTHHSPSPSTSQEKPTTTQKDSTKVRHGESSSDTRKSRKQKTDKRERHRSSTSSTTSKKSKGTRGHDSPRSSDEYIRPKKERRVRFQPLHYSGRKMSIGQQRKREELFDQGNLTKEQRKALDNWVPGTT